MFGACQVDLSTSNAIAVWKLKQRLQMYSMAFVSYGNGTEHTRAQRRHQRQKILTLLNGFELLLCYPKLFVNIESLAADDKRCATSCFPGTVMRSDFSIFESIIPM